MPQESEPLHEPSVPAEWVGPRELYDLLHRLEDVTDGTIVESPGIPDDFVTVEAIAEATGHSRAHVWETLERLRIEDAEARLSMALRELEAPLHRVERPGTDTGDPLAQYFRVPKGQSLSPLLDDIAKRSKLASRLFRDKKTAKEPNARFDLVSLLIMGLFTLLTVGAALYGIAHLPR